jgi:hypothetical protein
MTPRRYPPMLALAMLASLAWGGFPGGFPQGCAPAPERPTPRPVDPKIREAAEQYYIDKSRRKQERLAANRRRSMKKGDS